jgi:hypothetical protein
VPEPETWLMMTVGFGLLGSALRKRKRDAAGAASDADLTFTVPSR